MNEQATESNESAVAAPETGVGVGNTLYERQLERYARSIESDLDDAVDRYGLAFLYSLPVEERMLRQEEMGLPCRDASDHYNLGLAYAAKEDFARAIACWEQSLKLEPGLIEAVFNIALAHERLGDLADARAFYKRYVKEVADPEEARRIEDHLSEIGK